MFYSRSKKGFYPAELRADYEAAGSWPVDAIEISQAAEDIIRAGLENGGTVNEDLTITPKPQPSADEIKAQKLKAIEGLVQSMLDAAAQKVGYDNALSASSYAALPEGSPFQAEGMAFNLARANIWHHCYEVIAAVEAAQRPEPTIEDLMAELTEFLP